MALPATVLSITAAALTVVHGAWVYPSFLGEPQRGPILGLERGNSVFGVAAQGGLGVVHPRISLHQPYTTKAIYPFLGESRTVWRAEGVLRFHPIHVSSNVGTWRGGLHVGAGVVGTQDLYWSHSLYEYEVITPGIQQHATTVFGGSIDWVSPAGLGARLGYDRISWVESWDHTLQIQARPHWYLAATWTRPRHPESTRPAASPGVRHSSQALPDCGVVPRAGRAGRVGRQEQRRAPEG